MVGQITFLASQNVKIALLTGQQKVTQMLSLCAAVLDAAQSCMSTLTANGLWVLGCLKAKECYPLASTRSAWAGHGIFGH